MLLNAKKALYDDGPVALASRLDATNCRFIHNTPLFRQSYRALKYLKYLERLMQRGGPNTIACGVIATDGADNERGRIGAHDVKRVALRLWKTEHCILYGIGMRTPTP